MAAKQPSTQRYLDIAEVREGVVVMKDGTLRAVLAVSSINFALKSNDEQEALIAQYVQFLNTIDYPLQIVIHSRPLDIAPYLAKLAAREKEQQNELLRVQTADYRKFVGELVQIGDIMTKSFAIVIPYSPISDTRKGFFSRLQEALSPARVLRLKGERFQERKRELLQRVEHAASALQSIGLQSVMLETQALIELYYTLYNPEVSTNEKLVETEKLQIESP